jgi:hypothetical protein
VLFHLKTLVSLFFMITTLVTLFLGARCEPAIGSVAACYVGLIGPVNLVSELEFAVIGADGGHTTTRALTYIRAQAQTFILTSSWSVPTTVGRTAWQD